MSIKYYQSLVAADKARNKQAEVRRKAQSQQFYSTHRGIYQRPL